ncbi:LysE family translocator [Chromobacterium alticapitis]|uniref:Lysine transporter LysE n=1 Tax=Chromobacterium alticapitis TaxID=2073169 RepID=A0A2S5DLV8_9NEIS|nr:LysE family translocator [Chromobacterium alticapitis]POZ64035.1 lysine transporter LysE [Chromobacterium alticapitis]
MIPSTIPVDLALACSAYLLGAASPGPSNLAIMAVAMEDGRRAALTLALGVVLGSLFWGVMAALGLSAILAESATALLFMKFAAALYLFWLAFRSARSAATPGATGKRVAAKSAGSLLLRGLGMHLTNPKAIFVWLSIVALAMPPQAATADALKVVATCGVLGLAVFGGYALLFSQAMVRTAYLKIRRPLEGLLAAVFAYAGWRVLQSGLRHS